MSCCCARINELFRMIFSLECAMYPRRQHGHPGQDERTHAVRKFLRIPHAEGTFHAPDCSTSANAHKHRGYPKGLRAIQRAVEVVLRGPNLMSGGRQGGRACGGRRGCSYSWWGNCARGSLARWRRSTRSRPTRWRGNADSCLPRRRRGSRKRTSGSGSSSLSFQQDDWHC